jgi:hypothetical protein
MNHNIAQITKNQVKQVEIAPDIKQNPESIRNVLSINLILILDYILKLKQKYNILYVSQGRIARDLGFSIGYINRSIKKLKDMGFLDSFFRLSRTCLYYIPDFFYDPVIQSKLFHIFSAFRILALSLLIPNMASNLPSIQYRIRLLKEDINIDYTTKKISELVVNIVPTNTNLDSIPLAIKNLAQDLDKEPEKLISLARFSYPAIDFLRKQLKLYKPKLELGKEINYYSTICRNYSIENNLKIDYQFGYRMEFFLADRSLINLNVKDSKDSITIDQNSSRFNDLTNQDLTKEQKMDNEFYRLYTK